MFPGSEQLCVLVAEMLQHKPDDRPEMSDVQSRLNEMLQLFQQTPDDRPAMSADGDTLVQINPAAQVSPIALRIHRSSGASEIQESMFRESLDTTENGADVVMLETELREASTELNTSYSGAAAEDVITH